MSIMVLNELYDESTRSGWMTTENMEEDTEVGSRRLLFLLSHPSKWIHFFHILLVNIIAFPSWTEEYRDKYFYKAGISYAESKNLDYFTRPVKTPVWLILACNIFFSLRYTIFIFYTFTKVDHQNLHMNLEKLNEDEFDFVCMRSNCLKTMISNPEYLERLVYLPVFKICNQQLDFLYGTIFEGHFETLFLVVCLNVWATIMSHGVAIHQVLIRTSFKLVADQIAPSFSVQLEKRNIKLNMIKFSHSFLNHLVWIKMAKRSLAYRYIIDQQSEENAKAHFKAEARHQYEALARISILEGYGDAIETVYELVVDVDEGELPFGGGEEVIRNNDEQNIQQELKERESICSREFEIPPEYSNYIEDCLTFDTTDQWKRGLAKAYAFSHFCLMWSWYFCCLGLFGSAGYYYFSEAIPENREFLKNLRLNWNCSIWLRDDAQQEDHRPGNEKMVELSEPSSYWGLYMMLEIAVIITIPSLIQCTTLNNLFHCTNEVRMELHEFYLKLMTINQISHLIKLVLFYNPTEAIVNGRQEQFETINLLENYARRRLGRDAFISTQSDDCFMPMKLMREKCKLSMKFRLGLLFLDQLTRFDETEPKSSGYFETTLAHQELALVIFVQRLRREQRSIPTTTIMPLFVQGPNSLEQNLLDFYVELNEKLLITYFNLLDKMAGYHLPIGNMMVFAHLLTYTLSLIAVYFHRSFSRTSAWPLIMTGFCLYVSNLLIGFVSGINARGKYIEAQLWFLLARSSRLAPLDQRLAHLRRLWLRQLSSHEKTGGLVIKTHGLKVTYVGIIKLLFWITTIILFAYGNK